MHVKNFEYKFHKLHLNAYKTIEPYHLILPIFFQLLLCVYACKHICAIRLFCIQQVLYNCSRYYGINVSTHYWDYYPGLYFKVKPLQLIWRLGTHKFILVTNLQISFSDLTKMRGHYDSSPGIGLQVDDNTFKKYQFLILASCNRTFRVSHIPLSEGPGQVKLLIRQNVGGNQFPEPMSTHFIDGYVHHQVVTS